MKQPKNWENTQAYGDFEALELGGHICKVMGIEEVKSKAGNDMLIISLDIAEGEQKDYYANLYRNDTNADKKWRCIVYQLVEDNDGNTHKGLKTFITAIEKSNKGFDSNKIWDDKFASYFKDKLIGGVFGREQYKNTKDELKFTTKCVRFVDVDRIKKGVDVPDDKYLPGEKKVDFGTGDFVELETSGGLPF